MKKSSALLLALGLVASTVTGCAYGSAVASGDKVVILRQDAFLMGALRKAFVCKVGDTGLSGCSTAENP